MSEEQILSKQLAECMEFLIWLRGYEYTDGPIEERLVDLLERLAASA